MEARPDRIRIDEAGEWRSSGDTTFLPKSALLEGLPQPVSRTASLGHHRPPISFSPWELS